MLWLLSAEVVDPDEGRHIVGPDLWCKLIAKVISRRKTSPARKESMCKKEGIKQIKQDF